MAGQQTIEDLKEQLATQARTFEERLSVIEASWDACGLQEASAGGDQAPTALVDVGTSEQAGFATSRRVEESTPIVCCKLSVMRLRLQGVAASPWDHER